MFDVQLFVNNSENNKVGKNITSITTVTGVLKNSCSIITPTIEINISNVPMVNYAYIPQFGRYYFITDITSTVNGLWSISLKCDVLESFKRNIYENTAILARQQYLFNLYLHDDNLMLSSDTFTLFKDFPNTPNNFGNTWEYTLICAG